MADGADTQIIKEEKPDFVRIVRLSISFLGYFLQLADDAAGQSNKNLRHTI